MKSLSLKSFSSYMGGCPVPVEELLVLDADVSQVLLLFLSRKDSNTVRLKQFTFSNNT